MSPMMFPYGGAGEDMLASLGLAMVLAIPIFFAVKRHGVSRRWAACPALGLGMFWFRVRQLALPKASDPPKEAA